MDELKRTVVAVLRHISTQTHKCETILSETMIKQAIRQLQPPFSEMTFYQSVISMAKYDIRTLAINIYKLTEYVSRRNLGYIVRFIQHMCATIISTPSAFDVDFSTLSDTVLDMDVDQFDTHVVSQLQVCTSI